MRRPRLKLDSGKEEAYYHCMSRVVGAEWLLDDVAKELLRKQMWALAEYCGMEIVTYALMSNHYHILLRVPERRTVGDVELLGLYRRLHPNLKPHQELALRVVEQDMASNGDLAQRWREQQQRQMFVSDSVPAISWNPEARSRNLYVDRWKIESIWRP